MGPQANCCEALTNNQFNLKIWYKIHRPLWGLVIYQRRVRIMGEEEIIMYLSIVQWSTWTWRFFLGSGHYLFLFMARNHLFVFFAVKCTISGWFCISYNEILFCILLQGKSVDAVFPPNDMAFQNLLIWRQYRSLCLYRSPAACLMPVASLLTMLPHQSCHLWIPASNDSRLLLSFIDEDHKRKSYPECAGKCEWWFIPAMSNYHLEFCKLHMEKDIFQSYLDLFQL